MKHNGNHRQNNEKPMKTNGSTHDQKNDKICKKNAISLSADPRTPRLLTSNNVHILCNIYSAYVYVCVKCRFRRLPSCLINISLSWGKSWENPGKILAGHSKSIYLVLKPFKTSRTPF